MEEFYLKKPTLIDEEDFTNYLKELIMDSGALKGVVVEDGQSYQDLLEYYELAEKIPFKNYSQDKFPFYQFTLIRKSDERIIGAVNIRPFLTKHLSDNYEGNIGYSIRPSERGKGYGKVALRLAIEEFRKLNKKDNIIVCCYRENVASRKIIECLGGKLDKECEGVLTPQKYVIE